jgi:hypothetical protein
VDLKVPEAVGSMLNTMLSAGEESQLVREREITGETERLRSELADSALTGLLAIRPRAATDNTVIASESEAIQ